MFPNNRSTAFLGALFGLANTLFGQQGTTRYIATPIDIHFTSDGSPPEASNSRFFRPSALGENGVLAGTYSIYNVKGFAAITGQGMQGVFALGGLYPTPRPAPIEVTGARQDAWFTSSGLFNDSVSAAVGINGSNQVVGTANTHVDGVGMVGRAFITSPNGVGMRDLGLPSVPGAVNTLGTGINDSGQVIGIVSGYYGGIAGFITGPNGAGMRVLGNVGEYVEPTDIANDGRVAGITWSGLGGASRAFITGPDGVGITVLGTLGGGSTPISIWSEATGINGSGQVVGNSSVLGNDMQAFVTGPGGVGMVGLGTLGGAQSAAYDINDRGQVVGWADMDPTTSPTTRAFLYHPDLGGMIDLNSLVSIGGGGFLEQALAINDAGQILAAGGGSNWLLTPVAVPEGSTWTAVCAVCVLGGSVRFLRSRRSFRDSDGNARDGLVQS